MTSIFKDAHGLEMTAASEAAARAYDDAISAFLLSGQNIPDAVKAMFAADGELPLGLVLAGNFNILRGWRVMIPRAVETHAMLAAKRNLFLPREQLHIDALGAWAAGDGTSALRLWEEILATWPADMLAMKLAQYGHFYEGNAAAMQKSVEAVAPHMGDDMRFYANYLGLRAFGHEEAGNYAVAEGYGREAVALEPRDGWAAHAVAHVMEMTGRSADGAGWLNETEAGWIGANNFRYHLIWHRALMYLDLGDHDQVLAHYDAHWDETSEEYLDLCNAASLLLRMQFAGIDVGSRWASVRAKAETRLKEQVLCFADLHYLLALAHGGNAAGAESVLANMQAHAADGTSDGNAVAQAGLAIARAFKAHADGRYGTALGHLEATFDTMHLIGGSKAQRDLINLVAMDCAAKTGDAGNLSILADMRRGAFGYDDWANRTIKVGAA